MNERVQKTFNFLEWYQDNHKDLEDDHQYYWLDSHSETISFMYREKYVERAYFVIIKEKTKHWFSSYFNQDVYEYWVHRKSTEKAFEKHFYSKWNPVYEKFKEWIKLNE